MARRRSEPDLNLKTTSVRGSGKSKLQQRTAARAPARRGPSASANEDLRAEEAEETEDQENAAPVGLAWMPRVFFLLVVGLFMTVLVIEVINRMLRPTAWTPPPPVGAPALTFYGKSEGATQTTWILDEPAGGSGPPRLIQRLSHEQMKDTGEIRWSADGRAVYATGRRMTVRGPPVVRWIFEFDVAPSPRPPAGSARVLETAAAAGAGNNVDPPVGRMFVSKMEWAPPGGIAFVEDPAALTARWKQHGGTGALASSWYDLGVKRPYLYSWQTTRWENVLPD